MNLKDHSYSFCLLSTIIGLLSLSISYSSPILADNNVEQCLLAQLNNASDHMTVGEIRQQCRSKAAQKTFENTSAQGVIEQRIAQDKENALKPFTLLAYRPNYLLFGTYNHSDYNNAFVNSGVDQNRELDNSEIQFQLSLKAPLANDILGYPVDAYAGYTARSFWQAYNNDKSSPFRETNHEPEIWLQTYPNWNVAGFKLPEARFGFNHQSNGRSNPLSRSWNRLFLDLIAERNNLAVSFKPWYRIQESAENDDNPDITKYLGHYEIRSEYKHKDNIFSFMSRNNLESGFSRGSVELGWRFPLGSWSNIGGYVQYFNGFGESLIDYNERVNRIGVGIILTDWL